MDPILVEAKEKKEELVFKAKTIILSTVSKNGQPNASYAPCIVDSDNNFFIYISSLSKHTANLINNPILSLMIIEDESESENIFGRKRFTMDAIANQVKRDSEKWSKIIKLMEDKFGETISYLKNMTDFYMFKIKPQNGLLVHGFARAFRFSGNKLDDIHYLNEKGHTQKK